MDTENYSKKEIFSPEVYSSIEQWAEIAKESGVPVYVKGGAVRDSLINYLQGANLKAKDLDVVVPHGLFRVIQIAKRHEAEIIEKGKIRKLPRYLLKFPGSNLVSDLSLLLANPTTLGNLQNENDLLMQDALLSNFDINTFTLGLMDGQLHDPLGAMQALKNKTINLVSERILYLDPSTVIQGLKIVFKTGFALSSQTEESFRKNSAEILRLQEWFLKQKLAEVLEYTTKDQLLVTLGNLGILKARPDIVRLLDTI